MLEVVGVTVRFGERTVLDRFELFRPVRLLGVRVELERPAGEAGAS